MRALRYTGNGVVEVVEAPQPERRPGEVLVRVEASALCGSERHALSSGLPGNAGHEACGVLVDPGGTALPEGARVGLSAVVGCGRCPVCRAGRWLHCPEVRASSSTGWHAEYVAVHQDALYRTPPHLDATTGVLLAGDSLGVPARAMRRAPHADGDVVVIIGLGPVGLGHVLVRAWFGARVIAIEPSEYRQRLGRTLGATTVLRPGDPVEPGAAVVIECSGRPESITRAFDLVRNGGVVVQSAECHEDVPLNPSELIIRRELTYTGSWYFAPEDYDTMVGLLRDGLPVRRMLTHEVPAAAAPEVVSRFLDGQTGKVVLRWDH